MIWWAYTSISFIPRTNTIPCRCRASRWRRACTVIVAHAISPYKRLRTNEPHSFFFRAVKSQNQKPFWFSHIPRNDLSFEIGGVCSIGRAESDGYELRWRKRSSPMAILPYSLYKCQSRFFFYSASSISSLIPLLDITCLDLFNIQISDTTPRNVGLFLNFI